MKLLHIFSIDDEDEKGRNETKREIKKKSEIKKITIFYNRRLLPIKYRNIELYLNKKANSSTCSHDSRLIVLSFDLNERQKVDGLLSRNRKGK